MLLRKVFYRWQFIAAFVLPAWLFVGWGIWGESAWGILGLLIAAPASFLSLIVVAGVTAARATARQERAVSWIDVGIMTAWHLALIGVGFSGPTAGTFAVFAVLLALVAFWSAVWQLLRDSARRAQATFAEFERQAQMPPQAGARPQQPSTGPRRGPDDGDVIIVHEVRDPS